MPSVRTVTNSDPRSAAVVGKAALRAMQKLNLTGRVFGNVVGLSESTVSRLRSGEYELASNRKEFELAVLFIRLYRSLDAIVGGDDAAAQAWLVNSNSVLNDAPINLIQTAVGLVNVIQYLDSRRAIV